MIALEYRGTLPLLLFDSAKYVVEFRNKEMCGIFTIHYYNDDHDDGETSPDMITIMYMALGYRFSQFREVCVRHVQEARLQ